jgi:small subunit ribosomal protein S7
MTEIDMKTGVVGEAVSTNPEVKPVEKKPEVKVEPKAEKKSEVKPVEKKSVEPKSEVVEEPKVETPVEDDKKDIKGKSEPDLKMFGLWSSKGLRVTDPGLKGYISLKPVVVPRTGGRHGKKQFYKSKISLVERLMNHLFVPGHRGKKHLISSGKKTGKVSANWKIMKETLTILERRTKANPLQVLITAIENAALREEVTSFQMGGITARKAVITSPQRRIDLAMRLISQTSSKKAHSNPKGTAACLAEELLGCYNKDSNKSVAIKEKERIEREATGSR